MDFPIKLTRKTAPILFAHVPGQPKDTRFGLATSGIPLPDGGQAYVVEIDPAQPDHITILAYLDRWGRLFSCDTPQDIPPARYPTLQLFSDSTSAETQGSIDAFDSKGHSQTLCTLTCTRSRTGDLRVSLENLDAPIAVDTTELLGEKTTSELLALVFLAALEFPSRNAGQIVDLGTIYERLSNSNVFDAVNREVLEAQAAWADDPSLASGIERYLVHMLLEEGAVGKSADDFAVQMGDEFLDGPNARLIRTSDYADTYFIDFFYNTEDACMEDGNFRTTDETAEARRVLLGCESALNRFLLLARTLQRTPGGAGASEATCNQLDFQNIENICEQLGEVDPPASMAGLWNTHYNFAQMCENVSTPYRFTCNFMSSPVTGAFGAEVLCPRPERMPKSHVNPQTGEWEPLPLEERIAMASNYAAHTALLAAGMAFAASPDVETACINCLDTPGKNPLISISLQVTRAEWMAARQQAGAEFANPVAVLQALGAHISPDESGSLWPVEPLFRLEEGTFAGTLEGSVRDDNTKLNDEAAKLTGVNVARQLSIFEEGQRIAARSKVLGALETGGVDAAIEVLKNLHDKTEDLALRKLFSDLLDGFNAGTIDESSYLEISEAFSDAYDFKAPMTYAYALINEDEEEKAIPVLEDLLQQTQNLQGFTDTETTCYRYFDSYATRIIYAWKCTEDAAGREVRQMPDEAFLVHDALTQVRAREIGGDGIDALKHAQECIRLSPGRANSYLRAARVHFMQDAWAEEIDMCIQALNYAWNTEDAGLAYYWLGFAYWQIDKYELAAACYRRAIMLGCSMAEHAREEIAELANSVAGMQQRTFDAEDEILQRAGVPTHALHENAARIMEVAKAAADSHCVSLACVLGIAAQRVLHDDALMPTVRSFERMTHDPE